mmetsp:Transcript_11311/g.21424  ORF Transcript_11311/g.21424 Transcript_11311/m.21424 type:complete len:307 (+) Transcript_11311:87-1007(+)
MSDESLLGTVEGVPIGSIPSRVSDHTSAVLTDATLSSSSRDRQQDRFRQSFVQRLFERLLQRGPRRCIFCLAVPFVLFFVTFFVVFIWMILASTTTLASKCDQPFLHFFALIVVILQPVRDLFRSICLHYLPECSRSQGWKGLLLQTFWVDVPMAVLCIFGLRSARMSKTCQHNLWLSVTIFCWMSVGFHVFRLFCCRLLFLPVIQFLTRNITFEGQDAGCLEQVRSFPQVSSDSEDLVDIETGGFKECVICQYDLNGEDKPVLRTPCDHFYHVACLEEWCAKRSSCPLCRLSFLNLQAEQPSGRH